jgi:hypothetical protein
MHLIPKPVKQEVNCTVILSPLVFPGSQLPLCQKVQEIYKLTFVALAHLGPVL